MVQHYAVISYLKIEGYRLHTESNEWIKIEHLIRKKTQIKTTFFRVMTCCPISRRESEGIPEGLIKEAFSAHWV